MNFIVDAQLPRKLILLLRNAGHDAVHTLELPNRNRTTDAEINSISITEQRVVITLISLIVFYFRTDPGCFCWCQREILAIAI